MGTKLEELALLDEDKGCLGKAADDEPLFILRAQDVLAPATVEYWAAQLGAMRQQGTPASAKETEALLCVMRMRDWQAAHRERVKVPD